MLSHLPAATLILRSTQKQRSNCTPIATMYLHFISQRVVFFWCPFLGTPSSRTVDAEVREINSSTTALHFRSTRNEHSNRMPILAIVHLYRILQLNVFFRGPNTGMPRGTRK
jgi:hypothetical protein